MTDASYQTLLEQEARIRQLLADAMLKDLDAVKRWQDIRYAPLALAAICFGAGAAVFAAALALLKWIA